MCRYLFFFFLLSTLPGEKKKEKQQFGSSIWSLARGRREVLLSLGEDLFYSSSAFDSGKVFHSLVWERGALELNVKERQGQGFYFTTQTQRIWIGATQVKTSTGKMMSRLSLFFL